jgi:imidazolonepropionase
MDLVIRNARVLTLAGGRPQAGAALGDLGVIDNGTIVVSGSLIDRVSPRNTTVDEGEGEVIDAGGRVVMPAFVDCHTHACWAGSRLDEWEMRQQGATYLELLEAGGGIMSTVRAVREASEEELATLLRHRLERMLRHGSATVEVKSGYGLSTDDELKMLRAIRAAGEVWDGTATPTACIGHAIDPDMDHEAFVARTIDETLLAVHEEFPGIAVDAYCERGAWTTDDCIRLFESARQLGHPCRVHADQFNSLGMLPSAVALGLRSVDHLEASRHDELHALAASGVFGVMLPCSGFHLTDGGGRPSSTCPDFANGRAFVDAGGTLAIATNYNPGSAPSLSMPMAIALGVRRLGLSVNEAIASATLNGAALLGLDDRGAIAPGMRADLVILDHTDERELAHEFGGNPIVTVIAGGRVI